MSRYYDRYTLNYQIHRDTKGGGDTQQKAAAAANWLRFQSGAPCLRSWSRDFHSE